MVIPDPKNRPDRWYWGANREERSKLSQNEVEELTVKVGEYSRQRFVIGRRFILTKDCHGTPKGTGCTVVREWPNTMVRWDKWSKGGYGAGRREENLSFDLDADLKVVEKIKRGSEEKVGGVGED